MIMITTLAWLGMIAMSIYIIKSLQPIHYFIKDRLALQRERRRIRLQSNLFYNRSHILLKCGWFRCSTGFSKKKYFITNDEIRGWSDSKLNNYLEKTKQ